MTTTAKPLRVGVVGTGRIADEHLRFLSEADSCTLVAVCDRSPSVASVAAARFGADRAFVRHDEMLEATAPDVVHVCTPAASHATIARDCIDAGAHVIVEKPAALNTEQLDSLLDAAASAGRFILEDHNYRFNRPFRLLEERLHAGRYGAVKEIEATIIAPNIEGSRYADRNLTSASHGLPAGFIHEFITHLAYLTLQLLPGYHHVESRWHRVDGSSLSRFDAFDAAIRGAGCRALIHFGSVAGPRVNVVRVRGTRGSAECDLAIGVVREYVPRAVGSQLAPFADEFIGGVQSIVGSTRAFAGRLSGRSGFDGIHTFLARSYASMCGVGEPPVTPDEMRSVARLVDELIRGRDCS